MRPLRILTWHVHGSYLYYLSRIPHIFYVPINSSKSEGYVGKTPSYPWPDNVVEVPADEVKRLQFDCVVFQSRKNYLEDQYTLLSDEQRRLPCIYVEHDPPRESPTDTKHIVNNRNVLLVHVTQFNKLMWDNGMSPSLVIEHGVSVPTGITYRGDLEKGIVVINNIKKRGRRLGWDLFERVRRDLPLDLVGMGWEEADGIGEVRHHLLPEFEANYRFFFYPVRYTSLGLSLCEAMMIGMPIVALATTEVPTVIENGVSGIISNDIEVLTDAMRDLLFDRSHANKLGQGARKVAQERFSIERFKNDWMKAISFVTDVHPISLSRLREKRETPEQRIEESNRDYAGSTH